MIIKKKTGQLTFVVIFGASPEGSRYLEVAWNPQCHHKASILFTLV